MDRSGDRNCYCKFCFFKVNHFGNCTVQVHINGFVSLDTPPFPAFYPYFSSRYSVIAPFWADIDLRNTDGVVYFSKYSRSSEEARVTTKAAEVFQLVRQLIVFGEGDNGFLPTQVIVVTWVNVSPYPGRRFSSEVRYVITHVIYAEHLCTVVAKTGIA